MDQFIPDIYQQSIYTINYLSLKEAGIKCLIFDLNNTMAPLSTEIPDKKLKDLFAYLESLKFKLIIMSNDTKNRVAPFKEKLNIDASYNSKKPKKNKYLKILKLYHLKVHEIACIGDQLAIDIYGANKVGFTSILVNPISKIDISSMPFSSFIEKKIYQKLKKRGLLTKGVYYE